MITEHYHLRRPWFGAPLSMCHEHEHGDDGHTHLEDGWEESFTMTVEMEGEQTLDGTGETMSREDMITAELTEWWSAKSKETLERTVPKAVKYGSGSLELLGQALVMMIPKERRSRQAALQMACCMYAFGKISRAWAALLRGENPADDDYFDLEIYARMSAHIKEHGQWVG